MVYASEIRTRQRCDCGEMARYAYPILILGKPDTIFLCPTCLIHELEMQIAWCERRTGRNVQPAEETTLAALIRRYISLERTCGRHTPRQRETYIAEAREMLARLRDREMAHRRSQ